jgi:hypothetical protein
MRIFSNGGTTSLKIFSAAIVALVLAACTSSPTETLPPFDATITSVARNANDVSLIVSTDEGENTRLLHVSSATEILSELAGGKLEKVTSDNLVAGAHIRAVTTDVELRSLPPQYTAVQIVIAR